MMNETTAGARRFSAQAAPAWADTHCHLDYFVKDGTLDDTLARAREARVNLFITAGTAPDDWAIYRDLHQKFPAEIFYAAGIHPQEISENFEAALETLSSYFAAPHAPAAIGETGLDYYRLPADAARAARLKDLQQQAFRAQIHLANHVKKPLVVHARNAFADTVALLEQEGANWEQVVFHCFAEGPEEMRFLRERGAFASFTGVLTYKNAEIARQACLAQGPERLMLETDCPYLTPVPLRGKPNEPSYLPHTGRFAAGLFGMQETELAVLSTARARAFYGLANA